MKFYIVLITFNEVSTDGTSLIAF